MFPDDFDDIPVDDDPDLFEDVVTPVTGAVLPPEAFPDERTEEIRNPCLHCGADVARIKDTEPAPFSVVDARERFLVCAAARDGSWRWCRRNETIEHEGEMK